MTASLPRPSSAHASIAGREPKRDSSQPDATAPTIALALTVIGPRSAIASGRCRSVRITVSHPPTA